MERILGVCMTGLEHLTGLTSQHPLMERIIGCPRVVMIHLISGQARSETEKTESQQKWRNLPGSNGSV